MSINRRATFVVKESQQTMDLPTPVRSIRGRLRRSTMIPSMISCGDEGKEVMPESPQESNLKSTELRDIKLPINIINNNALDLVSLNLEHKVKDLDMSPEFTTKFKDTYSPNQETKARRVTFHASLSKASSKDTPDTSSPEMEPELEKQVVYHTFQKKK